jgi:DNA-binding response OmpR family regulator/anti-sigma regulatory factor (Ser/Thr protein kinase)
MSLRVLVVDDDFHIRELLRFVIEEQGWKAVCVEGGRRAMEEVQNVLPDCVILDLLMPEPDGFAVLKALKANPDTQAVPVIILSVVTNITDKVKGLAMGANDYVTKPFEPEEIVARIRTQVRIKELERRLLERQKEEALRELIIGLEDTLLNRLNILSLQVGDLDRLLAQEQLPEEIRDSIEEIRKSIVSVTEVLRELRNHSQVPILPEAFRRVNLPELISRAVAAVGVRVEVRLEEDLPQVIGHEGLVDVFAHLLKNAVEAAKPPEPPSIMVEAFADWEAQRVICRVRDRGVGIPREDLSKVFTPFFTTKGTRALGLGLWMVLRQITALGGEVDIESTEGEGTTVTVLLPIAEASGYGNPPSG